MGPSAKIISVVACFVALVSSAAESADKVRVISSTRLPFEMFAVNQAIQEGYFKKADLDTSLTYGSGGAATLQAVVAGSQDIAIGVGVLSVIAAYGQGAPVKILASVKRGAGDLYWYVPTKSPIQSFKDLGGKQLVFSRPGSSTDLVTQFILSEAGVSAKRVSVGGISASRTQVMSGQVDTGWSSFPLNLKQVREGKIRIIGRGSEAPQLNRMTIRVVAANANWLANNRATAERFMKALWRGHVFNYKGGDRALGRYIKRWNLEKEDALQFSKFVPWEETTWTPIGNLDGLLALALEFKLLRRPLTVEQKTKLVDIVYDPSASR